MDGMVFNVSKTISQATKRNEFYLYCTKNSFHIGVTSTSKIILYLCDLENLEMLVKKSLHSELDFGK